MPTQKTHTQQLHTNADNCYRKWDLRQQDFHDKQDLKSLREFDLPMEQQIYCEVNRHQHANFLVSNITQTPSVKKKKNHPTNTHTLLTHTQHRPSLVLSNLT